MTKLLRDRRTGNLKASHLIFADNCEELTCELYGVKNLNKENDNYRSPIDHTTHFKLGIIQTKGARLTVARQGILEYEKWSRSLLEEHNKEFDLLILYCANIDGKIIDRIYIFPWEDVIKTTSITIMKNNPCGWYEQYRVKEEELLKMANEIWQKIINKE